MTSQAIDLRTAASLPEGPPLAVSGAAVIRVTYLDQNEAFAAALPESGLLGCEIKRLSLQDWGDNWSLLKLAAPLLYHERRHRTMLIKSRWVGHEVGRSPRTSVFILLCAEAALFSEQELESADCDLVAWGMADALGTMQRHTLARTSQLQVRGTCRAAG